MLNKAILVGRLTRDPETRTSSNDIMMCTFTLAVDRDYKNRDGNKETDFIPIVAWRKTAELCSKYLKKGNLVAVAGRIQVRTYDASDGTRRYMTEVVSDEVSFLTPRSEASSGDSPYAQSSSKDSSFENYGIPVDGFTQIDDLDVPF